MHIVLVDWENNLVQIKDIFAGNLFGPSLDILEFVRAFNLGIGMAFVQKFGNEKGFEEVTAFATGILSTDFFVPLAQHEQEVMNHFITEPLAGL